MTRFAPRRFKAPALRYLWILLLVLACPFSTKAQDLRPWELNGGFSYMHLSTTGLPEKRNSFGAWGGTAYHVTRHFGLATEFAYQKNPSCSQNDIECLIEQLSQPLFITFSSIELLGGPRISSGGQKFDWFGHVMFGLARTRATIINQDTEEITITKSGARFATAYGAGMDWKVMDAFALRVFQVDYIPVRYSEETRHNIRIQVGVVVRLGGRR